MRVRLFQDFNIYVYINIIYGYIEFRASWSAIGYN